MAQALLELIDINGDKTRTLSDFNDEEICVLTLLQTITNRIKVKELDDFVVHYSQFKVSRNRLGRREIVNALSAGAYGQDDRRKSRSIKDLFGGMK